MTTEPGPRAVAFPQPMEDEYVYERAVFDTPQPAPPRDPTRGRSSNDPGPGPTIESVSYPLVERRRRNLGPPEGVERREDLIAEAAAAEASPPLQLGEAPPIAPFRWGALVVALVGSANQLFENFFPYGAVLLVLAAYANYTTIRPIPYRDDRPTRTLVAFDVLVHLGAVMLTGNWSSPFAFTLIPSTLLAGFSGGPTYAFQIVGTGAAVVSVRHLIEEGVQGGLRSTLAWCGVLALVALTSGLARRVSQESQRQQMIALDRLSKLAEANALLFSLQRVAQTLPASLDMDDVLDSTLTRLRPLIDADTVTVLLYSEPDRVWEPVRTRGYRSHGSYTTEQLPPPFREVMLANRSITVGDLAVEGPGVANDMASGMYASLRARGNLMGLICLESRTREFFDLQHAEMLNGFIEPFGIAIDNARLFRRLRNIGADEERSRIARELHDRIGNALAVVGFEVDRLTMQAQRGGDVAEPLAELRRQVSSVVGDVREALYDLRTDVSDSQDLVATLRMFCDRVSGRSPLAVTFTADADHRLPLLQERELWQIAREAITNAERHARAERLDVTWFARPNAIELRIEDDGQGFVKGAGRQDSYGLVGMKERAASINAVLDITSELDMGTKIRVSMGTGGGA